MTNVIQKAYKNLQSLTQLLYNISIEHLTKHDKSFKNVLQDCI